VSSLLVRKIISQKRDWRGGGGEVFQEKKKRKAGLKGTFIFRDEEGLLEENHGAV